MRKILIAIGMAVWLSLLATPAEAVVVSRMIYSYQNPVNGARTEIRILLDGSTLTACRDYYIRNLGASNCENYVLTRPGDGTRFVLQIQTWVRDSRS